MVTFRFSSYGAAYGSLEVLTSDLKAGQDYFIDYFLTL
jgi:hypothetical protein